MVSIIIPTYNRVSLLKEAVESCLKQTYTPIEIIIVDDGSTDNTEWQVNEWLKNEWKSKNIRYYKQINSGASAARNKGLELAQGEYIQFLDSDDILFPEKIETQLNAIKEKDADACSCFGIMGDTIETATTVLGEKFEDIKDLMHRMCSGRVHVMSTPAPLWKRLVLLQCEGWNTKIAFGDDLEYHIRVLMQVNKMAFVSEKLFFVREHKDNRLSDAYNNIKQIESGIQTQELVAENLKLNELWDKTFQNGVLRNARTLYANYLQLADKQNLSSFEKWLLAIAKHPGFRTDVFLLVLFRRIFGPKALIKTYKLLFNRS